MPARAREWPRRFDELTSREFEALAKKKPLVILPVGSLEEHGEHLPLGTDSFQAEEVARRVGLAFDAVLLPSIAYGDCHSTKNFPGTVTISFDTVRTISFDILSELSRNGIDKVLVLTGHAGSGHMMALRLGAQKAVESDPNLKVMLLSDYDLAYELRGKGFPEGDGHGGMIETSRILGIRPELVSKARPKGRNTAPRFMVLPHPEEHFPAGISGDASAASSKKGREIDDYVVGRLCELVSENFGMKRVQ